MEKVRFDVAKHHLATLALLSAIACILLSINQFIGLGLETNVYLEQTYLVIDLIAFPFFLIGLIIIFLYSLNFNLGNFGLVSFIIAFFGTCLVIGDVWFEIFVTPIIEEPGPKDILPPSMMAGAVLTFFSFSVGLILFGFCLFRRNVFPKWLCILFIMGAIFGQKVLTIPYIIVLATAVMVMNLRIYNEYKFTVKKREEPPITPEAFL